MKVCLGNDRELEVCKESGYVKVSITKTSKSVGELRSQSAYLTRHEAAAVAIAIKELLPRKK